MEKYCLSDIKWIFTEDGSFVTPFICNHDDTKIKDLENDEIICLPDDARTTFDKIVSVYAQELQIDENDLDVETFTRLINDGILKLKGIKNLKYLPIKIDINSDGFSNRIVTEEDIKCFTKEIVKTLKPKESEYEKLHNQTKNF